MGSYCGKDSSVVEPEADEGVFSGDLVLMRIATSDNDGVQIPVDAMSDISTATLGDQVSLRRKVLPSWDRAGVALVRRKNGIDAVYVAFAQATELKVMKLNEMLSDQTYAVIGVRRMTPKYDPELEEASLEEMLDVGATRLSPLERAVSEVENVLYSDLVQKTKDDSVLQCFDHVQRWCMEKVSLGSTAEYRKQVQKSKKKTQKTWYMQKKLEKAGFVEKEGEDLDLESMNNVELKSLLAKGGVRFKAAVQSAEPREALIDLIISHELHVKNKSQEETNQQDPLPETDGSQAFNGAETAPARRLGFKSAVMASMFANDMQARRKPSEAEWGHLLSTALEREVTPMQARKIVGQMEMQMCGRRDIGNHLSAEVSNICIKLEGGSCVAVGATLVSQDWSCQH
eukprot:TRINITY_DN12890_c0_g1_i5.p1 TRINITY_DN12890_c0_g1~~TRINITY_DN12890_c0_g1_i5.p1  ORF type:complete len:400 (-),score=76.92 TRINITY_DN12890_c0_g1_i5:468-1667(-)